MTRQNENKGDRLLSSDSREAIHARGKEAENPLGNLRFRDTEFLPLPRQSNNVSLLSKEDALLYS